MEKYICFRDLSWFLKIGIIGGIVCLVIYGAAFIIGFIEGILLAS